MHVKSGIWRVFRGLRMWERAERLRKQTPPAGPEALRLRSLLPDEMETRLLLAPVVFVAVDLARLPVLLAVDLLLFLRRQLATVGSAVVAHFLVDLRFVLFQVSSFPGGQLSALRSEEHTSELQSLRHLVCRL